jgi:hypothetical protein
MIIGAAVCTIPLSKRIAFLQCRFMAAIEALKSPAQERDHDADGGMSEAGNQMQ